MDPVTLLLILLIVLLVFAYPSWGHSQTWGYAPFGTVATVVVIVLIILLVGKH